MADIHQIFDLKSHTGVGTIFSIRKVITVVQIFRLEEIISCGILDVDVREIFFDARLTHVFKFLDRILHVREEIFF